MGIGATPPAVARSNRVRRLALALGAVAVASSPGILAAETSVGLTAGAVLAGHQDFGVNLLPPRPDGRRLHRDVPADAGALAGIAVAEWPDAWRWFGAGADASWWNTPVEFRRGKRHVDLDQTRTALFLQPLAKYPLTDGSFVFGGPGGGFAYTTVRHGSDSIGPALSLTTGLAITLTGTLRLRFDAQYVATHDADAARTPSQRIDVSGTARANPAHAVFGAHLDTQFVPLRVGLDWVFR
jgi:hypothetical protein